VLHKGVEYGVKEDRPGRWRWTIHPDAGPAVVGPPKYRTRELAVAAAIEEINNGIERGRRRKEP
jgi:hypothetical protein